MEELGQVPGCQEELCERHRTQISSSRATAVDVARLSEAVNGHDLKNSVRIILRSVLVESEEKEGPPVPPGLDGLRFLKKS